MRRASTYAGLDEGYAVCSSYGDSRPRVLYILRLLCPPSSSPLFWLPPLLHGSSPYLYPPLSLLSMPQSSLQVALGALSVVRAAVSDKNTALRLVKLGIVSKLAALVRQKPAGPPPPLPPRRRGSGAGSGDGGGSDGGATAEQKSPTGEAAPAAAAAPPRRESAGRREEVCAALRVLAGLAEQEACVPLVLEKEDLGFLLQVWVCMFGVCKARKLGSTGGSVGPLLSTAFFS